MYIIAGLGNPEPKYNKTRHNIGFRMVEALAERHHIRISDRKHKGLSGKGMIGGEKVLLIKPQTYMNLSGECIRAAAEYYQTEPSHIIVLFDDVSLDVGKLRVRKKGSAGGHNGIKSIIAQLGTEDFPRLKFGVGGKPAHMDLADYVLGRFDREDEAAVEDGIERACGAVECMLTDGFDTAMNRFNG